MSSTEAVTIEVPDIGDFADVPIIEILVSPGDQVTADDPLVTLESDKATMDVPAPFDGIVREMHVTVGDTVSQGTLLLSLEPSGGAPASDEVEIAAEAEEADAPRPSAPEPSAPEPAPGAPAPDGDGPLYASPSARRLARELGVELSAVAGSGRNGRITREDVQQHSDR